MSVDNLLFVFLLGVASYSLLSFASREERNRRTTNKALMVLLPFYKDMP